VSDNRVGVTGNQIVTGNVTGGREFRGPLGYSDAREFRDNTGFERSDRFIRDSNGAARSPTLLQQPTAFYGSRLAEPLPQNYAPTIGSTGGYVMTPSPVGAQLGNNPTGLSGVRPGASGPYAGSFDRPALGDLDASPLFGVRAAPNQSPADALRNDPLYSTSGDVRVNTDRALQQMRDELNNTGPGKIGDTTGGHRKKV